MPIQPLDLQTLFAHINQVGKEQAALKEGLAAQQAAHANELIKEMKHQDESVNKTTKTDEDNQKIQEEIGDTLFTLVNISRFLDLNAEDSLRITNEKFKKRFQYIEKHYNGDIELMKRATLQELDELWEKAKTEV